MRISWRVGLRVALVVAAAAILFVRLIPRHPARVGRRGGIADLSVTSPLNQPGGGAAPAEAYEVYSALYQGSTPMPGPTRGPTPGPTPGPGPAAEPLVFAEDSGTDIPQVGGSCLRPKTEDERTMVDAFEAANRQSHRWEQKFTIPQGYKLLDGGGVVEALNCLETHGQDAGRCSAYKGVQHVRILGVPGFDGTHTHALVSVIRKCGRYCGSGGVFEVEKAGGAWQRAATTDFTQDCSWAY